jgi:hypothetical protein
VALPADKRFGNHTGAVEGEHLAAFRILRDFRALQIKSRSGTGTIRNQIFPRALPEKTLPYPSGSRARRPRGQPANGRSGCGLRLCRRNRFRFSPACHVGMFATC